MLLAVAAVSCTSQNKWNREQKREMRQLLDAYRDMVYLNDMTDAEFIIFTDDVAGILEQNYPNYVTFAAMPNVDDTITMVVVTTIVTDLQANYRNMRHIFPYHDLVEAGVLPSGMSREQLTAFYTCLAGKINNYFGSLQAFIYGAMNSVLDDAMILGFQQSCAAQMATEVVVEETITVDSID